MAANRRSAATTHNELRRIRRTRREHFGSASSASSAFNVVSSEREAEHELRDPHEPGLLSDAAKIRVADGVATVQCSNRRAVQQVEHLDLDLRRLRAEPQALREDAVDV